ncbi:MAG: hypothetical protein [Doliovirus lythtis]|uniref:Uncharacterized protein n=1 Tax=Circoviridae sp. TaxID=1954248 RepID=A0A345MQ97_9VIRU|nr:MAG: hypothetical protein [Circoviridae sp.]
MDDDLSSRRAVAAHRNRNKAELWRLRSLFEDLIGTKEHWPNAIFKVFFFKLKPSNSDRFKLTVFLLCNGVDPLLIQEYYAVAYLFTQHQQRQIRDIIKKYPSSKWTAWNVSERKSM